MGDRSATSTAERKVVTILFADLVGSTALAERLDPEDWKAILDQALDRFAQTIARYDGTVAQMLGDGLLAFFGAPVAHEDDPLRAVRAGLDLVAAAGRYADELREQGIELAVRVGVNTGAVVVGPVGSDLKREYLAVGDAVNVAARMQSAAAPMTVLVSAATYRSIAAQLDVVDRGRLELKGKAQPVRAYEVRGVRSGPIELRGLDGLRSPLLGRDSELRALRARTAALAGAGGAVVLVGEPGIGKNRLLAEWRTAAGDAVEWSIAGCVSYGQALPYHLVADLVRALTGSAPADPYLQHLLGGHLAGGDPQSLHARYVSAVRDLLITAARVRPLVVVLNDTHWADASSVDILGGLFPLADELPVLFCLLTRPDRDSPGWGLVELARARGALELGLAPLAPAESAALVQNLLAIDTLPPGVIGSILVRAEGNPFFVEEIIRMLIERGAIAQRDGRWAAVADVDPGDLPEDLQGLLLGRIDRLPDDAKRLVKAAAVVGRQFDLRILARVMPDGAMLPSLIRGLEGAGLVERDGRTGDYAFRHALVHDAAYASLLKADRRELHQAVGSALVELDPERADELAATIGRHFEQADDAPRALTWLARAAGRARAQLALVEAAALYRRALRALSPAEDEIEFTLRFGLAECLSRIGAPVADTEAEFQRCLAIAPGDRDRASVHFLRGQHLHIFTSLDLAEAERCYLAALGLLDDSAQGELYGLVLAHLGYLYRYQRRPLESVETLERARAVVGRLGETRALAQAEIFLSGAYLDVDRADDALASARAGIAIAERVGDLELIGIGHSFIVDVLLDRARAGQGRSADALPHIEEMRRYGREHGVALLGAFAETAYADHAEQIGDLTGAVDAFGRAVGALRIASPSRAPVVEIERARLLLRLDRRAEAEAVVAAVRATAAPETIMRVELWVARAYADGADEAAAGVAIRRAFAAATPEQREPLRVEIATVARWTRLRTLVPPDPH